MLIGISIDDSENEAVVSALLELLMENSNRNLEDLDLPICLEYFDTFQLESAHSKLCESIYKILTDGSSVTIVEDDDYSPLYALTDWIQTISVANGLDIVLCRGVDIILTENTSRILIWFNKEDTIWKLAP